MRPEICTSTGELKTYVSLPVYTLTYGLVHVQELIASSDVATYMYATDTSSVVRVQISPL